MRRTNDPLLQAGYPGQPARGSTGWSASIRMNRFLRNHVGRSALCLIDTQAPRCYNEATGHYHYIQKGRIFHLDHCGR